MSTRRRLVGTQNAQFNQPGDSYTGIYISAEDVPYAGGKVLQKYSFKGAGGLYVVMGSTKIDEAMLEVSFGEVVEITYKGEATTSGGFTMRLFEIAVLEDGTNGEE